MKTVRLSFIITIGFLVSTAGAQTVSVYGMAGGGFYHSPRLNPAHGVPVSIGLTYQPEGKPIVAALETGMRNRIEYLSFGLGVVKSERLALLFVLDYYDRGKYDNGLPVMFGGNLTMIFEIYETELFSLPLYLRSGFSTRWVVSEAGIGVRVKF